MMETFDSTGGKRTTNNVMRHQYRELTSLEKAQMDAFKNYGVAFHTLCEQCGESRELSLAKTKIEEAVMWAIKHVTR